MRSLITDELDEELNSIQMEIATKEIPVAILFEGGSGRVISRVINELDRCLEPMGIHYYHFDASKRGTASVAELLQATPGKGEITLFDRSWYSMIVDRYDGDEEALKGQLKALRRFEEYLIDNGTFIIKIGLDISSENLRKYADEYRPFTALNNTFLSIDHIDRVKFRAVMPFIRSETDSKRAPWDIIEVSDIETTVCDTVRCVNKRLRQCLKGGWQKGDRYDVCKAYRNPGADWNSMRMRMTTRPAWRRSARRSRGCRSFWPSAVAPSPCVSRDGMLPVRADASNTSAMR